MPEKLTFDSEPLLAFFLGEPGAQTVQDYLSKIQNKQADGYINIINLTEIYYILYRLNPALADENISALGNLGLKVISVEDYDELWRNAAKIKAKHSLSLADAFAAATAEKQKSTLVIGTDKEFDELTIKLLKIRT
jgi:predicted nucleic acid-binding protein